MLKECTITNSTSTSQKEIMSCKDYRTTNCKNWKIIREGMTGKVKNKSSRTLSFFFLLLIWRIIFILYLCCLFVPITMWWCSIALLLFYFLLFIKFFVIFSNFLLNKICREPINHRVSWIYSGWDLNMCKKGINNKVYYS